VILDVDPQAIAKVLRAEHEGKLLQHHRRFGVNDAP
jgi:hypothetical protein